MARWHDAPGRGKSRPEPGDCETGGRWRIPPPGGSSSNLGRKAAPGPAARGSRASPLRSASSPRGVQPALPQGLRTGQIGDRRQAIFFLLRSDAGAIHRPGPPLSTVAAHLNRHRQPSLQANGHQPQFPIPIVKVKVQALALWRHQLPCRRDGKSTKGCRETTCDQNLLCYRRCGRRTASETAPWPTSGRCLAKTSCRKKLWSVSLFWLRPKAALCLWGESFLIGPDILNFWLKKQESTALQRRVRFFRGATLLPI